MSVDITLTNGAPANRSWSTNSIKSLDTRKSKKRSQRHKKKKFSWDDGEGRRLNAGGLIFYDDEGVWVIGEDTSKGIVYTDIGGKYSPDDGDIYQTIIREVMEESYYSIELNRGQLFEMIEKIGSTGKTYMYDNMGKPMYICFAINMDVAKEAGVSLSVPNFEKGRRYVFSHNKDYEEMYRVLELRYITFEEMNMGLAPCSYRLKTIVRHNQILSRFINYDNLRGSDTRLFSSS